MPRVTVLKGSEILIQDEDGAATAAILPGMLVQGVTEVAPHATAGAAARRTFALERDELGRGIGSPQIGGQSPAYAIGDTVKRGSFSPGMRVNALIAAGAEVSEGDWLESAGDGTLRTVGTPATAVAMALEDVDNGDGASPVHVRAEVY